MGWFWADSPSTPAAAAPAAAPPAGHPTSGTPPPSCPMHKPDTSVPAAAPPSECPYTPEQAKQAADQTMNPLNFMFANLPQTRAPGQKTVLPTEREISSIPKGDGGNWEYPSPQQMYNAMRRKGYEDAPEDAVESMVAVHNWLNEGAWDEICAWERKFGAGVLGYMGLREADKEWKPRLARFQGRRNDPTPKSQIYGFLGRLMPETFGGPPPFDRHDWYVLRKFPGEAEPREVRYVIDYYSGDPEPTGEPVFFIDVRPALDRPGLMMERIVNWTSETWDKASGMDVRKAAQAEAKRNA
ncbi:cytochrome c/c1 heme-lyase [Pyronema omphalodes]|nr:cytochrome c/c1 heme-lyase [Pyronema omphalodes]